jgi:hypothetical protein
MATQGSNNIERANELIDKIQKRQPIDAFSISPEIKRIALDKVNESAIPDKERIAAEIQFLKEDIEDYKAKTKTEIDKALDKSIPDLGTFKTELQEWQSAVKWLQEKFPEFTEHIAGVFGSTLIMRLSAGGFRTRIDPQWRVVLDWSNNISAGEIATNINNTQWVNQMIARGLIYQSKVTDSFIQSNTDSTGKVISDLSLAKLEQYSSTYRSNASKTNSLSAQDKVLIDSMWGIKLLLGWTDSQKLFRWYSETRDMTSSLMAVSNGTKDNKNASVDSKSTKGDLTPKKMEAPAGFFEKTWSTAGKFGGAIGWMFTDFVKWAWNENGLAWVVALIGTLFSFKHFFTEEFDIPGIGKMKWWKIFLGWVTGSAAAVEAWNYLFPNSKTEWPKATQVGIESTMLAANWLTRDYEKYGWLTERLNSANFQALKNWADDKTKPMPDAIASIVKDEKDPKSKAEKEEFLRNYILSFSSDKIPAVKTKVGMILQTQGADKMTLGDMRKAVYEWMKDQIWTLKTTLQQIINDPKSSPDDKRNAEVLLSEVTKAETSKDGNMLMTLSCIWILIGASYVAFQIVLKWLFWNKMLRPIGEWTGVLHKKEVSDAIKKTPWEKIKAIPSNVSNVSADIVNGGKVAVEWVALSRVSWLESKMIDFKSALMTHGITNVPTGHFDDLVDIAKDIDAMKWPANIFANAKKTTELNTRLLQVVSKLDDAHLATLMNSSEESIKSIATALKEMKAASSAVKGTEVLSLFRKIAK